jgi:ribonuclease Z
MVYAIRHVFLSHGHADHISGLVGLINIRNSAMGDREKPLNIYYPKGNWRISELMNYIVRTNRHLHYDLEWVPLEEGDKVQLFEGQNPRFLEAFETVHSQDERSLGYNIIEQRRRLKKEYENLSQEEIVEWVRQGKKSHLTYVYHQKLLSYGGDSIALDPVKIKGTEVLFHDATFLVEQDRKEYKHATLQEAVEVATLAGIKKELIAFHISSRYKLKEMEDKFKDLDFKVTLLPPGKVFRR